MAERFIDVVDMVYDGLYITIRRVFAFYYLDLSSTAVCEVLNYLALFIEGESHRPDEVWFVVFRSVLGV